MSEEVKMSARFADSIAMAAPVPTWQAPAPKDLVAAARRQFVSGQRVDLPAIAESLGISRATAYRWAGNTEQLVGNVISSLIDDTYELLRRETKRLKGAARILEINRRGMRYIATFRPLRQFLERDPEKGLRLIASKDGTVQKTTIGQIQRLLEEEIDGDRMKLPVDPHTMAYAITRIAETFLYADLIAGEKPDIDKADAILRLMLRE